MKIREYVEAKMGDKEYMNIHGWLSTTFGKANHCDNPNCSGTCKKYNWALKHECEYEYDVTNFYQLCVSCHIGYDNMLRFPDDGKVHLSDEHKQHIAESIHKLGHRSKLTRKKIRKGVIRNWVKRKLDKLQSQ